MIEEIKDMPKFKYHPNIYNIDKVLGAVSLRAGICECCGADTNVYIKSMYCRADVECICMECVANGKAAEKFDGTFIQDAEIINDNEKTNELFTRTPGYSSWQGEYWLACCDDYCEYIGDVGYMELKEIGLEYLIDDYKQRKGMEFESEFLVKGGAFAGYLFRCIHCKRYRLNIDFN